MAADGTGRPFAQPGKGKRSMIRWIFLTLALGVLAACANTSDTALPMVHPDDPTWGLVPDHLEFGALPK
jgi:hypothetical protein